MRPPEEVRRDLVRQWLVKAREDLTAAEILMAQQTPLLGIIGFHCQQAAEKYIKAFLVLHDIKFTKTHDIELLIDLIGNVDNSLADVLHDAIILSDYGVDVRYPGDIPELTPEEAKEAVKLVGMVKDAIRSALEEFLEKGSS